MHAVNITIRTGPRISRRAIPGRHAAPLGPGRSAAASAAAAAIMPGPRQARHAALRPPSTVGGRVAGIIVLVLIGTALLVFEYQFRDLEASTAAFMYGFITPTLAAGSAPIIWFGLGAPGAFGLIITPDCSSALLIAPLCLIGIGLMLPSRLAVRRVWTGLLGAAGLLVAGNLLRIGVIAWAVKIGGMATGYQLGHLIIGSLISIVCIAASLIFLTVTVTSQRGQHPVRDWAGRTVSAVKRRVAS